MSDMKEWVVQELTEEDLAEINENKANLPSCQTTEEEGSGGFGDPRPEEWDPTAPMVEEVE